MNPSHIGAGLCAEYNTQFFISNIILMRTLAVSLLLCLLLSGKAQTNNIVSEKETLLSIEQEFYSLGSYQGTAHKLFYISLQDSILIINTTSWKLVFIKELYKEDEEEMLKQYTSQDTKGNETTIRMYYEGTLLTDISFTRNYVSCHFYIIKAYSL